MVRALRRPTFEMMPEIAAPLALTSEDSANWFWMVGMSSTIV